MKLDYFLFILIVTLSSCKSDWIEFTSKEGAFRIDIPANPKSETIRQKSKYGIVESNVFYYIPDTDAESDENISYTVSYDIFPSTFQLNSKEEINNFLDEKIIANVGNVSGKLISDTYIDYKGYPGREAKIDFKNGLAIITQRIYLIDDRLYSIQVFTKTSHVFNKSIRKFFDSFEVKKR
jgi:hypothetical protein